MRSREHEGLLRQNVSRPSHSPGHGAGLQRRRLALPTPTLALLDSSETS